MNKQRAGRRVLTLHPANFEDAVRALLSTPPADSEKKNQSKKPVKSRKRR
jgi:hypothetical protein